jgi:TonB family protein
MFKSIFLIAQIVGVIAGKVVNSTTGEGIPSASVFVEGTTLGASTDKNGVYFIKDVPVGRYTLIATAVGFEVVKLSVVVMPDEVATVNFNLTPKTDERVRETAFGERYFDIVEEMPEIIGGLESIQRNLVYPETAIRAGVQGTVLVMAFVDENGNVERAEVVRGIGAGCDEAAVSAVMKVKFKPGKLNGKPVKARVLIPINFKLQVKPRIMIKGGLTLDGGIAFLTYPTKGFSEYWETTGVLLGFFMGIASNSGLFGFSLDISRFSFSNKEKFLRDLGYSKANVELEGGDIEIGNISLIGTVFITPSSELSPYVTFSIGYFGFFRQWTHISGSGEIVSRIEELEIKKFGISVMYGVGLRFKSLMLGLRGVTGLDSQLDVQYRQFQVMASLSLIF